jgi:hypothetical protein
MRKLSLVFLPLLVACAPAPGPTADGPAPAAQTAASTSTAAIAGDYTVTLAASDLPAAAPQELRTRVAGAWTMAFHGPNHFVGSLNGRQVLEGPYRVSGNQVMFSTGESGPYACNTPATYSWRTTTGRTVFALVGTDACAARILWMTSRPYTLAP